MPTKPEKLAKGLWRWTERHPEWHPGQFGSEVACFAVDAGDDTLLIDPLLPADPEPVLELVERTLGGRLAILITIPYHVRSSERLWKRFRAHVDTAIWGHPACAKRLEDSSGFREIAPGAELPGGASAYAIGRPRRFEMPLLVPSHAALVFGDAVAETSGALRVWADRRVDADVERFYRERFNPTLKPLLQLCFERVLVTHGRPVMRDGKGELRSALRRRPWYHRE
jgi:hypothetical protein